MKIINLAVVACMASLIACNSGKGTKDSDTRPDGQNDDAAPAYVVEKVSFKDSVVIGNSKAVAECSLGYLKSDDKENALVDSVDKWISSMLKDSDSSVAMGEPLAKYVVKDVLGDNESDLREWNDTFGRDSVDGYPPMSYEFSYEVMPLVTAPRYVTMLYNSYIFTGGAHGGAASIGRTFAASDGNMLGMDMFRPGTNDKVLELVKKGLMEQYFEVKTEKEFNDMLLVNNGTLPFPVNPPYFEEKGVCFLYQQYEIAPYAAGMPQCLIPFETLRPYFTEATLDLLDMD